MTDFDEDNIRPIDRVRNISRMLFFLFIFLLGIKGLGNGFSLLGGDLLDNIFQAMENPFLGLFVGAVVLALGYKLVTAWMAPDQTEPDIDQQAI